MFAQHHRSATCQVQLFWPSARHRPASPRPAPALCTQVLLAVAELLGCVSIARLDSVTEKFLLAMGSRIKGDAGSPARQQLYWLLQGMRFVQLRGDTPEQVCWRVRVRVGWGGL